MKTVDELMEMKKDLTQKNEERQRLLGQLEQLKETVQEKYECNTVREAKKLLQEMQKSLSVLTEEYEEKCEKFEKKYKEVFDAEL